MEKIVNLWINNRRLVQNIRKLWNARFAASFECPDVFVAKGALQDVILKKCVAELQNLRTDPVLCHGQIVAGVAAGALQVWGAPVSITTEMMCDFTAATNGSCWRCAGFKAQSFFHPRKLRKVYPDLNRNGQKVTTNKSNAFEKNSHRFELTLHHP